MSSTEAEVAALEPLLPNDEPRHSLRSASRPLEPKVPVGLVGDYDPSSAGDREWVVAVARSTFAPSPARWLRLDELVALARRPRRSPRQRR